MAMDKAQKMSLQKLQRDLNEANADLGEGEAGGVLVPEPSPPDYVYIQGTFANLGEAQAAMANLRDESNKVLEALRRSGILVKEGV